MLFGTGIAGENRIFDTIGYVDFNSDPLPVGHPSQFAWQAASVSDNNCDELKLTLDGAGSYSTAKLAASNSHFGPTAGAGHEIYVQVQMKTINATGSAKIGIQYTSPSAGVGTNFYGVQTPTGTTDWAWHSYKCQLFDDAVITGIAVQMPGSASTGIVYINGINIVTAHHLQVLPPIGHYSQSTKARGLNIDNTTNSAAYMKYIAGAYRPNLLRYGMALPSGSPILTDMAQYDAWFADELLQLDAALQYAVLLGMKVVVDYHTPPGGTDGRYLTMLETSPTFWDRWLANWTTLTTRYRNHPAVWGFEIQNEPGYSWDAPPHDPSLPTWWDMQDEAIKRIRAVDGAHPIIVSSDFYGDPRAFVGLKPFADKNIKYTFHFYGPSEYYLRTNWSGGTPVSYPGYKTTKTVWPAGAYQEWTAGKEYLRKYFQPVRDFQLRYGVDIYVGEFIDYKYCPGAAQCMADKISIFEEYGWDWTAFTQAGLNKNGIYSWADANLELANDKSTTGSVGPTTDRALLFINAFSQNQSLYSDEEKQASAPTGISVTDSTSSAVSLSWVPPLANVTSWTIRYRAEGDTWNTISNTDPTANSQTISGLSPDTTYTYQVTANNATGSATSQEVTAKKKYIALLSVISAGAQAVLAGAWSVRKIKSSYSGPCLRVRRSSDDTTMDVGFVGENLDTAALLAFVGSGSGYVAVWYDQNGANNISQASPLAQPRIVNAGVLDVAGAIAALVFSGSYLTKYGTLNLGQTNKGSIVGVAKNNASNGAALLAAEYNNSTSTQRFGWYSGAWRTTEIKMWAKDDANTTQIDPNGSPQPGGFPSGTSRGFAATFDGVSAPKVASSVNKMLVSDGTTVVSGSTRTLDAFAIGGTASYTTRISGQISEIVVFRDAISQVDITAMLENQVGYFGL